MLMACTRVYERLANFFSKTTNCSFLFWDKRNLRVLSYRHLLQRCPNPPSWSVHRKYAEVLCSCVVGATPSGTEGPPDSSFPAHMFVGLSSSPPTPVRFAGAHQAGCDSHFGLSAWLEGFTIVYFFHSCSF